MPKGAPFRASVGHTFATLIQRHLVKGKREKNVGLNRDRTLIKRGMVYREFPGRFPAFLLGVMKVIWQSRPVPERDGLKWSSFWTIIRLFEL